MPHLHQTANTVGLIPVFIYSNSIHHAPFSVVCNHGQFLCATEYQLVYWRRHLANNVSQLDKLVGFGMLVTASVVFLYYTIWTLLMVRRHVLCDLDRMLTPYVAICRRRPSSPERIPPSSLGHSNSRHPHPPGLSCCRFIPGHGYDSEQQKESSQSEGSWEEEGIIGLGC